MKIIEPSVEFFGAVPTDYESTVKFIEMAGRTCYRSEDKITETSAEKFVKGLIRHGHLAMVEHSNFVVKARSYISYPEEAPTLAGKYLNVFDNGEDVFIGGNLTAWRQRVEDLGNIPVFAPFLDAYGELFGLGDNAYSNEWQACPHNEIPAELHRYSAKFVCDRGVSHEIVRHRPTAMDWFGEFVDSPIDLYKVLDASFAQESTRYVNYGGKDMEFIEPAGYENWPPFTQDTFEDILNDCEQTYNILLDDGLKPQQARAVLPNALRTEIVVTADAKEWSHIRKLRTHKSAHPDIVRVMNMVPWEEFLC